MLFTDFFLFFFCNFILEVIYCSFFFPHLHSYADEPNIMKYIRIASTLQDKTVRDVAMRCRWMTVSYISSTPFYC